MGCDENLKVSREKPRKLRLQIKLYLFLVFWLDSVSYTEYGTQKDICLEYIDHVEPIGSVLGGTYVIWLPCIQNKFHFR